MTILSALLVCVAIKVTSAIEMGCSNAVQCPCGSKAENITVCLPSAGAYAKVCARLSKCESCNAKLAICSKCPEGLHGPFCSQETNKSRQKRQLEREYPVVVQRRPSITSSGSCPVLDTSKIGSISCVSDNGYEKCTGKCWPGYHFIFLGEDEMTLTCRRGSWRPWTSFPDCTKIPDAEMTFCEDPGTDTNGIRRPEKPPRGRQGFPQGSRLEYSCNQGYELDGEQKLFCLMSGEWSATRPKCFSKSEPPAIPETEMIFCEDPGTDLNGIRQPIRPPRGNSGFPQGSRLEYSCKNGYDLQGEQSLFCLMSGFWTASRPRCLLKNEPTETPDVKLIFCEDPGIDANSVRQPMMPPPGNRAFPQGSRLQYSCKKGYELQGEQNLFCLMSGVWTASPPKCLLQSQPPDLREHTGCDHPGPISNGRVVHTQSLNEKFGERQEVYPAGSQLQYSCNDGYNLIGSNSLTCLSPGKWSASPPICESNRKIVQKNSEDCGRLLKGASPLSQSYAYPIWKSYDWPFIVPISVQKDNSYKVVCLGALLNTRTVITAAHCLDETTTFILHFGTHGAMAQDDDPHASVRRSSGIMIHPDYSDTSLDSDIGLIFFQPAIQYSDDVQPICLPTAESTARHIVPGQKGFVSGYSGAATVPLSINDNWTLLRNADLPVVRQELCAEAYEGKKISRNMFCAGRESLNEYSVSVCSGKMGSPFIFYDATTGKFTLEGLLTFAEGSECGIRGRYAVFTKIFPYLPWIVRQLQ